MKTFVHCVDVRILVLFCRYTVHGCRMMRPVLNRVCVPHPDATHPITIASPSQRTTSTQKPKRNKGTTARKSTNDERIGSWNSLRMEQVHQPARSTRSTQRGRPRRIPPAEPKGQLPEQAERVSTPVWNEAHLRRRICDRWSLNSPGDLYATIAVTIAGRQLGLSAEKLDNAAVSQPGIYSKLAVLASATEFKNKAALALAAAIKERAGQGPLDVQLTEGDIDAVLGDPVGCCLPSQYEDKILTSLNS